MTKGIVNAYLTLLRPANIVTAFADILLGFGIVSIPLIHSHAAEWQPMLLLLLLLLLTTAGLYGGGVVLNDVCDADLDKIERPERPIPRGIISKTQALILTCFLFIIAIVSANLVGWVSGVITTAIMLLCIYYDTYGKHSLWLGPITMGLCRGANVLLGLSIVVSELTNYWFVAIIPFVYISGVTLVSKEEVHGGVRHLLYIALLLYVLTVIFTLMLNFCEDFHLLSALPFLILFVVLNFFVLLKCIKTLDPQQIKQAVKIGVLCLILLDAAIAAGFVGWWYGLLMLLLLPISIVLGKRFSVT